MLRYSEVWNIWSLYASPLLGHPETVMSLVHRCIPVEQMVARFMPNQRLLLTLFYFFYVCILIAVFHCIFVHSVVFTVSLKSCEKVVLVICWGMILYHGDDECINLSLSAQSSCWIIFQHGYIFFLFKNAGSYKRDQPLPNVRRMGSLPLIPVGCSLKDRRHDCTQTAWLHTNPCLWTFLSLWRVTCALSFCWAFCFWTAC